MDIAQITDVKELKAMAYDQIAAGEQAQKNLAVINNRIAQIMSDPQNTAAGTPSAGAQPANEPVDPAPSE